MRKIKIGIIGGGWMGTTHARAYNNIVQHYGTDIVPVLKTIVDVNENQAKKVQAQYGFRGYSMNWKDIISDQDIDLVMITTPNDTHIALTQEAAKAGKAVFCEKPVGMDLQEVKQGMDTLKAHNTINMVGFIYLNNPMVVQAKQLIDSSVLGKVVSFRGVYDMEYCAGADIPHTWRQYSQISGAVGDIGAHMLSISDYLVGGIDEICAKTQILYPQRPAPGDPSRMLPVENDDLAHAIYTYKNGAMGSLHCSRIAPGNKVGERFEVQLTKGNIRFDQERMNELEVYYHTGAPEDQGFKLIRAMPDHGEYGVFCTQAGLGISYIDLMTIQAHKMLTAIADNKPVTPNIETGYEVHAVMEAMFRSDAEHRWVKISECK